MQNVLWRVQNLPISSSLTNAVILCGTNNLQQDSPENIVDSIIEIRHCFKKKHHHINIFICGLLPCNECTSINCVYIIETNKILKVKCLLNKFFIIDQDTYWIQPKGCLNSDMFYLDKLHLVEKGNLVLAKSICSSMEYSQRIITRNEFKTLYELATAFQLNNADFPVMLSKYVCKAVSGCTKVLLSKFISNVVAKYHCKFVCVCKFFSVPMFAQSVCSPSYRVVKRCDFGFVNKVIIDTRHSVGVCHKVRKSVLVSVPTNVLHASPPDTINVTIVPSYQHFNSTKYVRNLFLVPRLFLLFLHQHLRLILLCLHISRTYCLLTPHALFVK